MTNLDYRNEKYIEKANALVEAAGGEDKEAMQKAFVDFAEHIQAEVLKEAEKYTVSKDSAVLAQRGVRQLTTEETSYYSKLKNAMLSTDIKKALADVDLVLPKTVINDVFTELETEHPLLEVIDFQFTGAVTEWLMNANPEQLATWSPLCAEIVKELTSGFKSIDLTQNKLSAFLPVCKAMLDLGPEWLDRYVRAILREALALGLEDGIINGKGQTANTHEPIGMRKDLEAQTSNGYSDKAKTELKALDPVSYGDALSKLCKTEKGNYRAVNNVIMVVNPFDYLKKVMPATTPRASDGTYSYNVFPFPTTVIQSTRLAAGEAILGLGSRYFMATGTGKSGKIEYSDEYQFLEDKRVYLTKFYGHGQPKDNNAFLLLDISKLEPTIQKVEVITEA